MKTYQKFDKLNVDSHDLEPKIGGPVKLQILHLPFNPTGDIYLHNKSPISQSEGLLLFRYPYEELTVITHAKEPIIDFEINIVINGSMAEIV